MAQLVVRNLEEPVKARLRACAARNRRSMEEEVRDILRDAANAGEAESGGLGTRIVARFREKVGKLGLGGDCGARDDCDQKCQTSR